MKLIKPLLIYITWIAFVWCGVAYLTSDYQLIFDSMVARMIFIVVWPVFWVVVILLTLIALDETNNT